MEEQAGPSSSLIADSANGDIRLSRLAQSIKLLDNGTRIAGRDDVAAASSQATKTATFGITKSTFTPRYVRHDAFDVSSYLSPTSFGSSMLNSSNLALCTISEDNEVKEDAMKFKSAHRGYLLDADDIPSPDVFFEMARSDSNILPASLFYEEFFLSLQENAGATQVFALLDSFIGLCNHKLDVLNKIIPKLPSNESKWRRAKFITRALQNEANTWDLLRTLYTDRMGGLADEDMIEAESAENKRMSERECVEALYERDSSLRQSQLVVGWLEHIAAKEMEDNAYDRYEFFNNKEFCWEATLNILNGKTRPQVFGMERLVTELDPDAPIRQQRSLASLDEENRVTFLKCLFLYIRSGKMEQAELLCEHYGEYWRAATLQGWRLYHDPNYSRANGTSNTVQNMDGNPNRNIWKATCWKLSEDDRLNPFERASYAALCGNLDSVLLVCTTWEERMWAHFRAMIDVRVETELRLHWNGDVRGRRRGTRNAASSLFQLPSTYWERTQTPESIFQDLKSPLNGTAQNESSNHFREIQKFIILDDVEGLLQEVYGQVQHGESEGSQDHPHFVRFAAHLVIFLRTVAACSSKEDLCDAILEEYVKVLVNERCLRLVPAYTAKLPSKQQVFWYARFLEGIKKRDEQQLCLRLAEECSLDVALITKTVVENARRKLSAKGDYDGGKLRAELTADDQTKIDAIDWLIFDPLQRLEAMRQANAITRTFLAVHKLDAARAVFNKIPPDSIDIIMKRWQAQCHSEPGHEDLPTVIDNTTREYLCLQAYLQAQDAFNDWFEHFHHGKPEAPPQLPPSGVPLAERMSQEHRQAQHEADLDRWTDQLDHLTTISVGKMYNVLLFVDGGWMVDRRLLADDEERTDSMTRLREICLPQVAVLLHSVLHSTGRFKASLELANIITSEHHQLYKVFSKQELRRLLSKLRDSSLRLLDQNFDPFGYKIQ